MLIFFSVIPIRHSRVILAGIQWLTASHSEASKQETKTLDSRQNHAGMTGR
jgi:hypothetical protein